MPPVTRLLKAVQPSSLGKPSLSLLLRCCCSMQREAERDRKAFF